MDHTYRKQHLTIAGLTALFISSLAGSLCGTFAWYTYGSRAPLYYDGTSIGSGGSLEIGIESEVELPEYEDYDLEKDESITGKTIYWSTGGLPAATLSYVLANNGCATNYLRPITVGKHTIEDPVTLYNGPEYRTTQNDNYYDDIVSKKRFVNMPLVFRYKPNNNYNYYVGNYIVYLEAAVPNSYTNIKQGIRLLIDGKDAAKNTTQYLINPNEDYQTNLSVGGPLDLNDDGYFDTFTQNFEEYEIAYGEFANNTIIYNSDAEELDSDIPAEEITSFNAKHKAGTYSFSNGSTTSAYCECLGSKQFVDHTTPLSFPDSEKGNYAFLNAKIFLEGWDKSIITPNIGAEFSLDLSFEVVYAGA